MQPSYHLLYGLWSLLDLVFLSNIEKSLYLDRELLKGLLSASFWLSKKPFIWNYLSKFLIDPLLTQSDLFLRCFTLISKNPANTEKCFWWVLFMRFVYWSFVSVYGKTIQRWKFTKSFAWSLVIWQWFLFVEIIGRYWAVWEFGNAEYLIGEGLDHRLSVKVATVFVVELDKTQIIQQISIEKCLP